MSSSGCLDYAITCDLVDPGRIDIFERWETQAAVEAFRGSGPRDEQSAAMLSASGRGVRHRGHTLPRLSGNQPRHNG